MTHPAYPTPIPPIPRLGRGIVWSDIVREIEKEQELRIENGGRLSRYDRKMYMY